MALVFAARGTSADARYSNGGKTGVVFGGWSIAADAGAISGSAYLAAATNTAKNIIWAGRLNTPNGRAISIHQRIKPAYSGTPSANRPVLPFLTVDGGRFGRIEAYHDTSGNLITTITNELGTVVVSAGSHGAWSPTSGTWYDIVLTWDGTTTANAVKLYVDATLMGSGLTATGAFSASWANTWFDGISLSGSILAMNHNGSSIDGIHIWDSVIDPTSVTLDSGTGSLNGASRTSPITSTSLDGALWTALTADKIVSGNSQTQAGVVVNGTHVAAAAANVRAGTNTGTTVGTLEVPDPSDVRDGVDTDNTTGTLDLPAEADVKIDVDFDGATKTGTYTGTDRWTAIPEAKVELGYNYKSNSTVANKTGTLAGGGGTTIILPGGKGAIGGGGSGFGIF